MKSFLIHALFAMMAGVCLAEGSPPGDSLPPVDESIRKAVPLKAPKHFHGWGDAINPDGDCSFFLKKGAMLIQVPGLPNPHDLAAELNQINAPRVLRPVTGDFTIQVQVTGRFSPGQKSTLPGRAGYNGAGLVAMAGPQNVVCLARAVFHYSEGEPTHYANFEMRSEGQLQRLGLSGDHPLPKDAPAYLRLERRGDRILGAVSIDGRKWNVLESKQLPPSWPKDLQVGLTAISTSAEEFTPHFSKLQVLK